MGQLEKAGLHSTILFALQRFHAELEGPMTPALHLAILQLASRAEVSDITARNVLYAIETTPTSDARAEILTRVFEPFMAQIEMTA